MSQQKFSADRIFNGKKFLADDAVIITNNTGTIIDIVPKKDAGSNVQHFKGILAPGFINAHCHLELSHMKGVIPEHTGLPDFILSIVNQRHFPEDKILAEIANAEAEMITNGIVAVGDISNNALTLKQKQKNKLTYYNFIEVSGWKPEIAETRYLNALDVMMHFKEQNPAANLSLSPHAPYSVSSLLWEKIVPHFAGNTVTIHNQETIAENQLFNDGSGDFISMYQAMNIDQTHFTPTGKSSLASYIHLLANAKNILLVHNTLTTENDIMLAHQQSTTNNNKVYWCLCVNANLYIENTVPDIQLLRNQKSNIVVGTDSLSSNHSLSILDELKTIHQRFPDIPLAETLQWATLNGARALQLNHQFGSLEIAKKPGIIVLENVGDIINENTTVKRVL